MTSVQPGSDPAGADLELPTLGRRFGALVIDWVLCVLVAGIFSDPIRAGWPPVLVLILERAVFVGIFAQTPGMRLTRIACVSYAHGGPIGVPRALLRSVLFVLVVPPLIMDAQLRGLHDRVAGSIMQVVPRSEGAKA